MYHTHLKKHCFKNTVLPVNVDYFTACICTLHAPSFTLEFDNNKHQRQINFKVFWMNIMPVRDRKLYQWWQKVLTYGTALTAEALEGLLSRSRPGPCWGPKRQSSQSSAIFTNFSFMKALRLSNLISRYYQRNLPNVLITLVNQNSLLMV